MAILKRNIDTILKTKALIKDYNKINSGGSL
jgi:hypothetical protein